MEDGDHVARIEIWKADEAPPMMRGHLDAVEPEDWVVFAEVNASMGEDALELLENQWRTLYSVVDRKCLEKGIVLHLRARGI